MELYRPKGAVRDLASATERAKSAAAGVGSGGVRVRCLRSIFVPEEETWFLLYEGPSAEAVRDAVDRAALPCARVMEAIAPR